MLEKARQEIVLTIAFLGRDAGSERLEGTITSLISRLAEADKAILAALSAPVPLADAARIALEHAKTRFACLADHFKEHGEEALCVMSEVDGERMDKALAALSCSAPVPPAADGVQGLYFEPSGDGMGACIHDANGAIICEAKYTDFESDPSYPERVMRLLIEPINDALAKEREACALIVERWLDDTGLRRSATDAIRNRSPSSGTGAVPVQSSAPVATCLTNCAQILDIVRAEWKAEGVWSEWDQSVRDQITNCLTAFSSAPEATVSGEVAAYRWREKGANWHSSWRYLDTGLKPKNLVPTYADATIEIEPLYTSPQDVGREATIEECASVKVKIINIGTRTDEYLIGFEAACRAYIDAIRSLSRKGGER